MQIFPVVVDSLESQQGKIRNIDFSKWKSTKGWETWSCKWLQVTISPLAACLAKLRAACRHACRDCGESRIWIPPVQMDGTQTNGSAEDVKKLLLPAAVVEVEVEVEAEAKAEAEAEVEVEAHNRAMPRMIPSFSKTVNQKKRS